MTHGVHRSLSMLLSDALLRNAHTIWLYFWSNRSLIKIRSSGVDVASEQKEGKRKQPWQSESSVPRSEEERRPRLNVNA